MTTVKHYRELIAWQKAMALVTEVYRVTATFPSEERFGLIAQLRRAAVSEPSNIAEGQGRASKREFRQFLSHSKGSLCEVETQFQIAENLGFLPKAEHEPLQCLADEVGRIVNGLTRSLGEPDEER